jgi:hypothetical protein
MGRAWIAGALLIAGCGGAHRKVVPAIAPPATTERRVEDAPAGGTWTVRIVSTVPAPAAMRTERAGAAPVSFTYRDGNEWRTVQLAAPAPRAGVPIDRLSGWAHDRDGTLYVTAQWTGNPDQANNIGLGLYRVGPQGALTSIVDCFTPIPTAGVGRFNEIGLPIVDGGEVAFWAGRGGGVWSGVYFWSGGTLTTVADQSGPIVGQGTPSLDRGAVAFVGSPATSPNARALYYWTRRHVAPYRIAGDGDPMPPPAAPGERIADIVIADPVVADGRVWFDVRGTAGQPTTARILVWDGQTVSTAVHASALAAGGAVLIQVDDIAVAGDAVAFMAGLGGPSGIFVARDGIVEEVIRDDARIGGVVVTRAFRIAEHGFTGTELYLGGILADGGHVVLRADYRPPGGR